MEKCPLCNGTISRMSDTQIIAGRPVELFCSRCGRYKIEESALSMLGETIIGFRKRANISGWLSENKDTTINSDNLKNLLRLKTPSFHERADKLLMILEKSTTYAGEKIERDKSWISSAWCINDKELDEIISYLVSAKMIVLSNPNDFSESKIEPKGWEHLEQLKKINLNSQQGFVAMWFDESLKKIYDEIIDPAIFQAGYKPHRVDQREHNNKIDDEIISEIRRSRFVLADFTGHRGGVYFEAGFAKGLGIEVFWTCRKDDIENLHFDIRQFNCIDWELDKLEDFGRRITFRIESVIGRGTYKV